MNGLGCQRRASRVFIKRIRHGCPFKVFVDILAKGIGNSCHGNLGGPFIRLLTLIGLQSLIGKSSEPTCSRT